MTVRFNSLFNDVKKGSYTVKHTDVANTYWVYSDIAYAKHAGWFNGYADGSFKGDNAITRAAVGRKHFILVYIAHNKVRLFSNN